MSHVQLFATSSTVTLQASLSLDFPGKNTRGGCHFFLQGVFPPQGANPCLLCFLGWEVDSLPWHKLGTNLMIDVLKYIFNCL